MPDILKPDRWAASSQGNMFANLTTPFAGGARARDVACDATGQAAMPEVTRDPLLVVAPAAALGTTGLRVTAVLLPGNAPASFGTVVFAPWSEAGAFLPLHLPTVDPNVRTAAPFTLLLTLASIAADGTATAIAANRIAGLIRLQLIEGIFGRLLYALSAEKHTIRRQARELAAMRQLSGAAGDALDRVGAEVGVPRLADRLAADAGHIVLQPWTDAGGVPIPEPDDNYRRRLALFRPFLRATRARLDDTLNGPGASNAPNAGLLAGLGVQARLRIDEQVNPFAVAAHLISAGSDAVRTNFLGFIRAAHLIWPQDEATAKGVHLARALSPERRASVETLRASLRQSFDFPAQAALAPLLASALERVGRCRRALGQAAHWSVTRAQDGSAGSRYELGLGVDLKPPAAADLDALAAAVAHPPAIADAELAALVSAMAPVPSATDPTGAWFLNACGLQTVYTVDAATLYVSHLPAFGLVIAGPANAAVDAAVNLQAAYQAPGDPAVNVVIHDGLAASLAQWTASGAAAWTALSAVDATTAWNAAAPHAAADPPLAVFRAAGLADLTVPAPIVAQLEVLPAELVTAIALPAALASAVLAGTPSAADDLKRLVGLLAANGLASVLPFTTTDHRVILTIGAIGLPGAGVNLSDRRSVGFRWYTVALAGSGGKIKPIGSRTVFTSASAGLTAVVVLGYARRPGLNDPYEFRTDLPDGTLLTIPQYEYLMNVLGEILPIGVLVNTFALRQSGVDLNGDGHPDPLPPGAARTFRPFRQDRHRGLVVPPLTAADAGA
ncbi:hypothetical protein [Burkholderia pyrrocinia]|uniref:hypothetical protein n=1 Tax=Burkholderia pyrrocinia TaxID=60550 RepID=UPI001BCCD01F|nr:hypothetical protein [Burkholderia pyrrocinia]QVN21770.1 hypothetical protein JYG32_20520 [Burkholderia pyrrocinia]